MSTELVVERILCDAKAEADAIVKEAELKAEKILAEASARSEKLRIETEEETKAKCDFILEKKGAGARLDGAKLFLKEKRKVIDTIYDEALSRLLELSKEDSVKLVVRLLEKYAEEGDVIVFAKNFPYEAEIKIHPVVSAKGLTISSERLPLSGGLRLQGKTCDKDLSYGALLLADRDEYQSALAEKLFR